ncbi:hypothetical protein Q1695_001266 [Nippostrongylus brasiliensis]|nr:hypothetical protein Q1695_001266 [Nippostrongylus brasiliensis]
MCSNIVIALFRVNSCYSSGIIDANDYSDDLRRNSYNMEDTQVGSTEGREKEATGSSNRLELRVKYKEYQRTNATNLGPNAIRSEIEGAECRQTSAFEDRFRMARERLLKVLELCSCFCHDCGQGILFLRLSTIL